MQTCAHCHTPVPDDATYCFNCGSLVSDAEGQAAATGSMDDSSWRHMEELLREDTAGEFEIVKLIGRGGMAAVYLAKETLLARNVAIKVLPPELTFGHGIERFMREAKTAASLDHPSIIPIHRISSSGKIFWYAMKYLEGNSLEEDLKERGRYSLEETVGILSQAADALDYGHEHQVIHRDVKPANIMLDRRRHVTVTDFGIAKALTEATLTASGSVIGTPYYMSPEQGTGKGVTGASDEYSLGITAYQMLSGQRPFEGDSAVEILHKHCMVEPPPLDEVCPELPVHAILAVHRALAKKPEQRFPTVSAFVDGLRHPWRDMDETATLVFPRRSVRAARPRRRPVRMWLATTLVVAAAAVGAWLALRPAAAPEQTSRTAAEGDSGLPTTPPPVSTTGTVTVLGTRQDGTLRVDDTVRADTQFALTAGPHVFQIEAPGYRTMTDTVTVVPGQSRQLAFDAQRIPARQPQRPAPRVEEERPPAAPPSPQLGLVVIRTVGGWADIFINDERVRRGSAHRAEMLPGIYRVRAERDGFVPIDTTISITANDTTTVVLEMRGQTP